MIKVGRPINGITINGNEWLLDDAGTDVRKFEDKAEALEFLGMTEGEAVDEGIVFEEIEEYPYCEAVGKILDERSYNELEEYGDHVSMAVAAYDCTDGCVNERYWDMEDLDRSIIRKFRYALWGILRELGLGEFDSDYDIIVEPSYDDRVEYVVIKDGVLLYRGGDKAWHFGHDGGDDARNELEEEFRMLASAIKNREDNPPVEVAYWLREKGMKELCDNSDDVIGVAERLLEKGGARDIVGEVCFRAPDKKVYRGMISYDVVEADASYVTDLLNELREEAEMEQERKDSS